MYLQALTERLAEGIRQLPGEFRQRHAAYLHAAQNADGGYSGRLGGSDLYYTAFALRSLVILDALSPEIARRAAEYLRSCLTQQAGVVDFFSLLFGCLLVQAAGGPDVLASSAGDWPDRVSAALELFRSADGGYGKTPAARLGSTYQTFLVGLCYQLLGRQPPRNDELIGFIRSRQRPDGGFVEIAPLLRSGTNPTAAAVGTLQLLGNDFSDIAPAVSGFLIEMQSNEGGLRANGRIPFADLLSTFTGCWTLHQLAALDRVPADQVRGFAIGLQGDRGGFRGHAFDEQCDVEYTFYGLGTLALVGKHR